MKKGYILSFILGIVLCGTVVVIADNLNASEIDYRDTKVDQALDTLYQRSTYTDCISGSYIKPANSQINIPLNFTPTKFLITLNNPSNSSLITYETNEIANKTYSHTLRNGSWTSTESTAVAISGNSIISSVGESSTGIYGANTTVYYIACK